MDIEKINIASNETILELVKSLKSRLKTAERLTIIAMSMMLIQTTVLVGGILYFLNTFEVEMSTETITQTSEGETAIINNVSGENNSVTNELGGDK